MDSKDSWRPFADPSLPISFHYPNPTPKGFTVQSNKYQTPASDRVQFVLDGSDEVYFEVGKYSGLGLREVVTEFLDGLKVHIEALQIDPEVQVEVVGCQGMRFTIHLPGKTRRVNFFKRKDNLFR